MEGGATLYERYKVVIKFSRRELIWVVFNILVVEMFTVVVRTYMIYVDSRKRYWILKIRLQEK